MNRPQNFPIVFRVLLVAAREGLGWGLLWLLPLPIPDLRPLRLAS